ncbi:MAG: hypothetical protein HY711_05905 [Candidatus Melainabacteria bacterium]|nr:hypothetical protein [Candidatus Melainabacteria bacterium]
MLTQSKVNSAECFIARLIASSGAGAAVFLIATQLADKYTPLNNVPLQIGLALITFVLTFFVTRNVFNFTADCLDIPAMSSAFQKTRATTGGRPAKPNAHTPATPNPTATKSSEGRGAQTAAKSVPSTATSARPADTTAGAADLWTASQDDGSLKVRITTNGLTKREFNMLRGRLDNITGVKWDKPVNLRNGQRKLEGVLPKGSNQDQALQRLQALTGKRV